MPSTIDSWLSSLDAMDLYGFGQFGDPAEAQARLDAMTPEERDALSPQELRAIKLPILAARNPGRYTFRRTNAPQLYQGLGRQLGRLNRQQTQFEYGSAVEGIAGAAFEQNRDYFNRAADLGLSRESALMRREEIGPLYQQQIGAARGQIFGQGIQREAEIASGITDAIQKSVDFQRVMDLNRFLAAKARQAARAGQKTDQWIEAAGVISQGAKAAASFGTGGVPTP